MDRVRTALVGCGKIGRTHAKALASLSESEFVAVCDVEADRAASLATRFEVRPYDDLTRLLQENQVDVLLPFQGNRPEPCDPRVSHRSPYNSAFIPSS